MKRLFIASFFILQAIKPIIMMFFYKFINNFHPTIMGDYEMYLMVMKYIIAGTMLPSYIISFLTAELLFLILPFLIYKKYFISPNDVDKG